MSKNVLVACEFSGRVRDAFIAEGHNAVSCDLLPTESPGPHYQENITEVLSRTKGHWDLVIAHPPCTYLCNSGVRWLHEQEGRWELMSQAAHFFKSLLDCCGRVCVENPVMHGYAKEIVGQDFSQSIQPWQFGDNYKKRTCLWLKGLPHLIPTSKLKGDTAEAEVHMASPGPDRWKKRSLTYPGIAKAMAKQWGPLL